MAKEIIHHEDSGGSGFLLAILLLIVFVFVFWWWGLPMLRQTSQEGVQINVPSEIDLNINQSETGNN